MHVDVGQHFFYPCWWFESEKPNVFVGFIVIAFNLADITIGLFKWTFKKRLYLAPGFNDCVGIYRDDYKNKC